MSQLLILALAAIAGIVMAFGLGVLAGAPRHAEVGYRCGDCGRRFDATGGDDAVHQWLEHECEDDDG